MGWDLYGRKEESYFRVNLYVWPRLGLALYFLGADTEKMATDNSGKYVPAATARAWADAIEEGIDSLGLAIISDSSCEDDEGWFLIPTSYGRKEVRQLLKDFYGEPQRRRLESTDAEGRSSISYIELEGHRSYRVLRIEPLSEELRKYLLDFASFCRRSGGFTQC
ncbi:MAG: hypothetical protein JW880_04975 [Candidatus Thermoplasmatota archaeon]|nr:hypothetical protein [Candidatus Thermoplasmatota archaeon]